MHGVSVENLKKDTFTKYDNEIWWHFRESKRY